MSKNVTTGTRAVVTVRNATAVAYRASYSVVATASSGYSTADAATAALVNVRSPGAAEGAMILKKNST